MPSAVNGMCADIHADAVGAVEVEHGAQVSLDRNGMDGATKASGQTGYFVRSQTRIKGVLFEDRPCTPGGCLLAFCELGIRAPKLRRGTVTIGHQTGGN